MNKLQDYWILGVLLAILGPTRQILTGTCSESHNKDAYSLYSFLDLGCPNQGG